MSLPSVSLEKMGRQLKGWVLGEVPASLPLSKYVGCVIDITDLLQFDDMVCFVYTVTWAVADGWRAGAIDVALGESSLPDELLFEVWGVAWGGTAAPNGMTMVGFMKTSSLRVPVLYCPNLDTANYCTTFAHPLLLNKYAMDNWCGYITGGAGSNRLIVFGRKVRKL